VNFAIKDQPNAKELAKAWLVFLEGGSPVPETWAKLVCQLAPVLNERGLEPRQYFQPSRRAA